MRAIFNWFAPCATKTTARKPRFLAAYAQATERVREQIRDGADGIKIGNESRSRTLGIVNLKRTTDKSREVANRQTGCSRPDVSGKALATERKTSSRTLTRRYQLKSESID